MIRHQLPPPDGTRYYDLSEHPYDEATRVAIALIEYDSLPVRLPDGLWLHPERNARIQHAPGAKKYPTKRKQST